MTKDVTEWCPSCDREVEMKWDVEADGYKAYCPYCGEQLMLCDECRHPGGEFCDKCNYDAETDTCKHSGWYLTAQKRPTEDDAEKDAPTLFDLLENGA